MPMGSAGLNLLTTARNIIQCRNFLLPILFFLHSGLGVVALILIFLGRNNRRRKLIAYPWIVFFVRFASFIA